MNNTKKEGKSNNQSNLKKEKKKKSLYKIMHDISKKMKEKATADSGRNFPPPLNDLNSYIGPQNLKKKKKIQKQKQTAEIQKINS